ncbi:MAG: HAMP domain-containing histidine kinase [Bacteroidales bacterium]|nr:HAMP domain-containing histidine kinase [Bacteroidales bacterium]MCM1416938.1 HAMP domain-containing histidine kinase [bacterium]MCM1424631.1 HAMP domain-containing histidine kinase [bacterium]
MRDFQTKKIKYTARKATRLVFYGVVSVFGIAVLAAALNLIFLLSFAFVYANTNEYYIYGGDVMEALTDTGSGYILSEEMTETFEQEDQWAMLLDENGKVVWSIRKPAELADEYSRSEIARMSKWYLEGYPVHMRVWDDRIMIVGMQKDTMWKYTMEFTIPLMDFVKRVFLLFLLVNVVWIVALAFFFTWRYARRKERARIEWIAGVSHDIRTPLSMVMGYADALEHTEELGEEARQQAAVIRNQSLVMKELIADLNLTSQLEYSMQPLRKEKVRPAEILRSVVATFLNDDAADVLEMTPDITQDAEQMTVWADRQLLIRAFRNLITNSMKHSGQADGVQIRIRLWKEKRRCCIRFEDNGVGYSEEILRRLQKRKKKDVNTNIRGLEIVKKVVLAHGGRVRFGNREEGGSFCEMRFRCS